MIRTLIGNRQALFDLKGLRWKTVTEAAGSSHAEIVRVCEDAARDAVLADRMKVRSKGLITALQRRTHMRLPRPGEQA